MSEQRKEKGVVQDSIIDRVITHDEQAASKVLQY